jgi:hypothetical protein
MRIERDRGLFACDHCGSQQDAPAALSYVELLSETTSSCPTCSTPLSASRLDAGELRRIAIAPDG